MAIDAFLLFEQPGNGAQEIKGESQDDDFPASKNWNAVHNVTFGSENVGNVATSTGGSGAGKLKFKEFSIKKQVDIGSPFMFSALCTGGHYGKVTLACRKTTGEKKPQPFLKYIFIEVKVLGIDVALGEDDAAPMEDIKFSYAAMQIEYHSQDATGKLGEAKITQWSQTKNAPVLQA